MLAAFDDIGDLLRLGVVALFVVGSALGGIIKNIRAKREKASQEGPILGEAEPLAPPQRRQQPRHPVARPMPPQPSPTTDRPVAKASPLQRVAPQGPQPDWLELASQAAGLAPPLAQPDTGPTAPPPGPAATPSSAARRREPASRRLADRPLPPQPPPPALASQLAGAGRPTPAGRQRRAKATPRRTPKTASPQKAAPKRKKSLSEQMRASDAESAIVAEQISDELDTIHHPTRASLRHAIVLSELLGPPLALRPPDDAL